MGWDELGRMAAAENAHDREKAIGIYIAVLAVLLAIASMGGGNASGDASNKNIEATNTWAFFQAKNMRRHVLRLRIDELELQLKTEQQMPEANVTAINEMIASYKAQDQKLTSDPERKEGLDQLFEKAKALEAQRDLALSQGPSFDYANACLQIAIVLASAAIISSSATLLLALSFLLGAAGAILTFNGFTLAMPFFSELLR